MSVPWVTRIRDALSAVGHRLRRQYYVRVWQMDIGRGTMISSTAKLDKTNPRGIHIGNYSVVSFGSAILTHDWVNDCHRDVRIGDNCFIGAHAMVLPGVTIGDNCIVGAASLVARNIPAGSLVIGNPARVVESNVKTTRYGIRVGAQASPEVIQPESKPKPCPT